MRYRALLYEPDDDVAAYFAAALASDACEPVRVHDAAELDRLVRADEEPAIAVVVIEPLAGGSAGLAVLQALEALPRRPPVLVTTAFPTLVERLPAIDFVLPKPVGGDTLRVFVDGLARKRALPAPPAADPEAIERRARRRLKEIMEVRLLDGHLNERLQEVAERAARLFETPMAWVTLLLPDAVVAKAVVGTPHQVDGRYPVEAYCCRHTVQGETVLELPDVAEVPVLADYFKAKKGVDFCYLGAPIVTATGTVVGTLCVGDSKPRTFGPDDAELIDLYARRLGDEIERRNQKDAAERRLAELSRELMFDRHGSWSRLGYIERAELGVARALRRGEAVAELRVIIDHLGDVYAQAGVEAAETRMGEIVHALVAVVGGDAIVGRMSDEQLAVFVAGQGEAACLALAERVRAAIAAARLDVPGGGSTRLTASIGVATGASTHAALARRAELAAAQARRRGRDRVELYRAGEPAPADASGQRAPLERGWVLDGKYFVEGELAAGGMGVIYRALDLHLERRVAIKVLRPQLAGASPGYLELFRREATQMAQVRHDHLAQVYAFALDAGVAFIVMELIEGASVADELRAASGRRLRPSRVARIVRDVGAALDAVHAAGLVHRDVKPGNVLLSRDRERAVLVDFGVSGRVRAIEGGGGTRAYMSPEGLAGEPEAATADVWALAASAYRMLTGALAFSAGEREEMRARQRQGVPPASSLRPRLGAEVDRVLAAGMAFDPARRIPSAGAFAAELALAIGRLPVDDEGSDEAAAAPAGAASPAAAVVTRTSGLRDASVRGDLVVAIGAIAHERFGLALPLVDGALWVPSAELRRALGALAALADRAGEDPAPLARAAGRRALGAAVARGHAIAPVTRGAAALEGGLAQAWRRLSDQGSLVLARTSDRSAWVTLEHVQDAPMTLVDLVAGFVDRFAEEAGLRHASCAIERREAPPRLALTWQ